jgi:hypothetical protein
MLSDKIKKKNQLKHKNNQQTGQLNQTLGPGSCEWDNPIESK